MQLCFVSAIYTFLSFKARRVIFLAGFLSNSIVGDVISSEVHVLSLCSRSVSWWSDRKLCSPFCPPARARSHEPKQSQVTLILEVNKIISKGQATRNQSLELPENMIKTRGLLNWPTLAYVDRKGRLRHKSFNNVNKMGTSNVLQRFVCDLTKDRWF